MVRKLALFAFLLLVPLFHAAPLRALRALPSYQAASGGFRNLPTEDASASATADALLLVSLFGLRNQINAFESSRFLPTLENTDGGYGPFPGRPSDLASVRNVLLAYQHLGLAVPNAANVLAYVKTLQSPTGTFSSRLGEKPDLLSTLYGLQSLEYLGETDSIVSMASHLNTYLSSHLATDYFLFDEELLDPVVANFYALQIAQYSRFSYDAEEFARWVGTNSRSETATVEVTSAAIASLHILDPVGISSASVEAYFSQQAGESLHDAALAYRAIAYTNDIKDMFSTQVTYEVDQPQNDDSIVQGTQLKPVLTIRALGIPHPGLDVEVQITYEDEDPIALKLQWVQESAQYQAYNFYDTAHQLGSLTFDFGVRYFVPSIGELSFPISDSKQVGYGITVTADAQLPALSRKIAEGDEVVSGTEFAFTVSLRNSTENIAFGSFDVVFSVLDASRVSLYSQIISASSGKAFDFKYTLESLNVPSGSLNFRFGIREAGVVHSTKVISYTITTPMVASQIAFEGGLDKYIIGSEVVVSMVPASYDLQKASAFSRFDSNKADVGNQRTFYMDLITPSGAVVHSAIGRPVPDSGEALKLKFTIPIASTLDFLGQNVFVFRYVGSSGETVLKNFDSKTNQLYDAASPLGFTVDADLQMVDVIEKPKADADFFYGNEISFQFKLKDSISERTVIASEKAFGNVFLTLQHPTTDNDRPFVSVKEPAVMEGDYFVINWAINPNAVRGDGELVVAAEDARQGSHALFTAPGESVKYKVHIGGEINVKSQTFATEVGDESAFIVDFGLDCNGKTLNDARLRATVSIAKDGKLVPVVRAAVATTEGRYQASWTAKNAASGTYVLQFYRETDLARAQELRNQRELKQRKDKGTATSESSDIEQEVTPLFKVEVQHQATPKPVLPVRTEVFVLGVLLLAYLAITSQKP